MLRAMPGRMLAVGAAALALVASANGRAPTLVERTDITRTMPAFVRNLPLGCAWLQISISETNPNWALVVAEYLDEPGAQENDPCVRYASKGYWILKKTVQWKIVFHGSKPPPCTPGWPKDFRLAGFCRLAWRTG
jgi:hypothetical protein